MEPLDFYGDLLREAPGIPVDLARRYVEVPGITEMIHFLPRAKISEEELKAHRSALRRGLPSPLTGRQLEEVARRREVYLRIKGAVTPEYVRAIGKFLNWCDDIGDGMTTAAWGAKGAAYVAEKMGYRIGARVVPYIGWALLAKDIFDVVNVFKLARAVRGKAKQERWRDIETNPFGKKARASRATRLRRGRPTLGDYLEILQTTDALFGVGISFGPAVGFAIDAAFGVATGVPIVKSWKEYKSPIDACLDSFSAGCFMNGF